MLNLRKCCLAVFLFLAVCAVSHAGFSTINQFSDPFSGTGVDPNWVTCNTTDTAPMLVSTAKTSSGQALALVGSDPAGQVMLVSNTGNWTDQTVSCWILPKSSPAVTWQGVIADANPGFSFAKTDHFVTATFLHYFGGSFIRMTANGADVGGGFLGTSIPNDTAVPGNPFDGNFHKITLVVNHDGIHPWCSAYWDDQFMYSFGPDAGWAARTAVGQCGILYESQQGAATDQSLFSNFSANWGTAPKGFALNTAFSDPFGGSAIDSNWLQYGTSSTVALIANPTTATLPSNDGKVLQITQTAKNGVKVMVVNGTDNWVDETVSVSFLPTKNNVWSQIGVMANVSTNFNLAFTTDTYVYVKYENLYGAPFLRVERNGPQVYNNFDANPPVWDTYPSLPAAAAANAFDGKFHKLTLRIDHHFNASEALISVFWDDVNLYNYPVANGPQYDSPRFPIGRVGVFTDLNDGSSNTFLLDNFQATWDNNTVPVTLSRFEME